MLSTQEASIYTL